MRTRISPIALCASILLHVGLFYTFKTAPALKTKTHNLPLSYTVTLAPNTPAQSQSNSNELSADIKITPLDPPMPSELGAELADQHYYLKKELSTAPSVVFDSTSDTELELSHTVILAIYINEKGEVDEVEIESEIKLAPEQEQALQQTFKHMKFKPGMRGDKPVKSLLRIEVLSNQIEINP